MNGIFKGKAYGTVTVGERGQLVIPANLRKVFGIKSKDELMVFANMEKKIISLMPVNDFSRFLEKASKVISKLENNLKKKD